MESKVNQSQFRSLSPQQQNWAIFSGASYQDCIRAHFKNHTKEINSSFNKDIVLSLNDYANEDTQHSLELDLNETASSKTRRSLSIKTKKEIIELSKQGITHQDIAKRLNVGRSTVTKILLNKNLVKEGALDLYDDTRRRIRSGAFDELELELFKWCTAGLKHQQPKMYIGRHTTFDYLSTQVAVRESLTKEEIICEANNIAKALGSKGFVGNSAWFLRFKRRFRLNIETKTKKSKNIKAKDHSLNLTRPILPCVHSHTFSLASNAPKYCDLKFNIKSNVTCDLYTNNLEETKGIKSDQNLSPEYNQCYDYTKLPSEFELMFNYDTYPADQNPYLTSFNGSIYKASMGISPPLSSEEGYGYADFRYESFPYILTSTFCQSPNHLSYPSPNYPQPYSPHDFEVEQTSTAYSNYGCGS